VYCALRLNLPRRTVRRLPRRPRQPLAAVAELNRTWALDFMADTLYDRRRLRILTILDEGNRDALDLTIGMSITSRRVVRVLDELAAVHGAPDAIRVDNGPEFLAQPFVDWSGGWVVFQRGVIQSAPVTLWRVPLAGGTAVQLADGTRIRPVISPNGRLVAHYWLTPEQWTLAIVSVDGSRPMQVFPLSSTHCGRTVRWSSDSRAVAFIDCADGIANIWLQPLDGAPLGG
jgi:Integrase core domain